MEWKKVDSWPYEVSDTGLVRSIRSGKILKPDISNDKYERVTFSVGGTVARFFVNRLVCEAFHGKPPPEATCARHLNGNSFDNHSTNLAWGTDSQNEQDKRRHGTYQSREGNPFAKLTEKDVSEIRQRYFQNKAERRKRGFKRVENGLLPTLAHEFGVSIPCIKFAVSGRNWPLLEAA